MAGSIAVTQTLVPVIPAGSNSALLARSRPGPSDVFKTSIVWTSDAAGAVSGNTLLMPSGSVVSVEFVPGAGGVQPTDLYDVTFLDAESVNMFDDGSGTTSIGANLSNVNTTHKVPLIGGAANTYVRMWLHGGTYTPVVANGGNAKSGTINIFHSLKVL